MPQLQFPHSDLYCDNPLKLSEQQVRMSQNQLIMVVTLVWQLPSG
jgi:hypothetical protein